MLDRALMMLLNLALFVLACLGAVGVLTGLIMCLLAALQIGGTAGGRWRWPLRVLAFFCVVELVTFAVLFVVLEPELHAERYLPDVEHASQPLIVAVEAFEREHGAPPKTLAELVPAHIAVIPETGYPVDSQFKFKSYPNGEWMLWVECEYLALDCDVMQYRSTDPIWRFVIVR